MCHDPSVYAFICSYIMVIMGLSIYTGLLNVSKMSFCVNIRVGNWGYLLNKLQVHYDDVICMSFDDIRRNWVACGYK